MPCRFESGRGHHVETLCFLRAGVPKESITLLALPRAFLNRNMRISAPGDVTIGAGRAVNIPVPGNVNVASDVIVEAVSLKTYQYGGFQAGAPDDGRPAITGASV